MYYETVDFCFNGLDGPIYRVNGQSICFIPGLPSSSNYNKFIWTIQHCEDYILLFDMSVCGLASYEVIKHSDPKFF